MMGTDKSGNSKSGSRKKSEPVFLQIGQLRKPHGIRGEINLHLSANFPLELGVGSALYIGSIRQLYRIDTVRAAGNHLIVSFRGISDREVVQNLTNQNVFVQESQLPERAIEEFYFHEVVGMDVQNENGEVIGKIQDILSTGANDVYIIKPTHGEEEILIPAISSVVLGVDKESNLMIVKLQEWY